MPSPVRRSARAAQPPTSKPAAPTSHSSTSSLSSRQDRSVKATNAQSKSATPRSLSSEEMEPRRSQRALPVKDQKAVAGSQTAGDNLGDEEEVTRCICGQQEYPGPPLSEVFSTLEAQGDDVGGLFIQCDGCSVWQHGGCVGIIDENQSPDKYYCEDCRPKLHDQHVDERGQRYSNYLPLHPQAKRKTPLSKSEDKTKREREATASRASADPSTGRRRGTMRSKEHDDEEEQLLRALEESKRDAEPSRNGRKSVKRGRDADEDIKQESKRQRTVSESLTSISRTATLDDEESDEDTTTLSRTKKARAEAAQSARQAELREKEKERDKARAEAAGRRQERAGRRRGDELEDDIGKTGASARSSPPASPPPPSPPSFAAPEKPARKGPGKKPKRLGNNQYTKARDLLHQPSTSSPHGKSRAATAHGGHISSGDEQLPNGDSHPTTTSNSTNKNSPGAHENGGATSTAGKGKFGRPKHKAVHGLSGTSKVPLDPQELSLADMERALDGMSAFVQRAQTEIQGDRTPPGTSLAGGGGGGSMDLSAAPTSGAVLMDDKPFEQLSSVEMAERLSRNIERWKRLFGQQKLAPPVQAVQ